MSNVFICLRESFDNCGVVSGRVLQTSPRRIIDDWSCIYLQHLKEPVMCLDWLALHGRYQRHEQLGLEVAAPPRKRVDV